MGFALVAANVQGLDAGGAYTNLHEDTKLNVMHIFSMGLLPRLR